MFFLPLNKFVIISFFVHRYNRSNNIKSNIYKWSRKRSSYSREVKKSKTIQIVVSFHQVKSSTIHAAISKWKKSTQLADQFRLGIGKIRKLPPVLINLANLTESINFVARKRRRARNRFFSREIEHRVEAELPLPPDPNVRPDRRSSRED